MPETRIQFHQELEDIGKEIVRLAAHAIEFIPRGTDIVLASDLDAAQELIDADDVVDALSIEIEERCYSILALQQPMARDLREVITAIRLVAEIERSADLMVNVAKAVRRIYPIELPPPVRGKIEQMADQASRLFRLAVDAYVDKDAGLAAALDDIDDRLDQVHRDYIQTIFEHQEKLDLQVAVQLALIGRYYERVGDHAVNVGERIRYMVDGWLPEHAGAAREAVREAARQAGDEGENGDGQR